MKMSEIEKRWLKDRLPSLREQECPPVQMRITREGRHDQYILWINWNGAFDGQKAQNVLKSPNVGHIYLKESRQRTSTWMVLSHPDRESGLVVYHEGPDQNMDYELCVRWYNMQQRSSMAKQGGGKARRQSQPEVPAILASQLGRHSSMMPFCAAG